MTQSIEEDVLTIASMAFITIDISCSDDYKTAERLRLEAEAAEEERLRLEKEEAEAKAREAEA